jgi:chromosome segregation ATPase
MLIEFSCPVCQTSLAIKKQVIGGQVNCPKCQKLILLPSESPLPRKQENEPPYQSGLQYAPREITRAISISVEPYRRDLDIKSDLMNDAVEMVKTRNERITEIETLMLNTQRDLWALEAEHNDQAEECKRIYNELHRLRQRKPDATEDTKEDQEALQQELIVLETKKDKLKARLSNMVTHSENLDRQLKSAHSLLQHEGPLFSLLQSLEAQLQQQIKSGAKNQVDLDHARDYLQQAAEKLLQMQRNLTDGDQKRIETEELVHSATQDMHFAMDERNQWRKRSEELEKQLTNLQESVSGTELQLSAMDKLKKEWEQDRDLSKRLQAELEENLALLRKRIEVEREQHQTQLAEKEQKLKNSSEKKIDSLELKLRQAHEELSETESKLESSLHTQHQLAEQNVQNEKQRKKLKAQLAEALAKIESLES